VPLPQLYAIQAAAGRQTETISACLASIDRPETLPTGDRYALTLRRFRDQSSACTAVAAIDGTAVRGWIDEAWGGRLTATPPPGDRRVPLGLGVLEAAGLSAEDPTAPLRRRKVVTDRSRALIRAEVEQLLTRDSGLAAWMASARHLLERQSPAPVSAGRHAAPPARAP
jgi:hypothetical protein